MVSINETSREKVIQQHNGPQYPLDVRRTGRKTSNPGSLFYGYCQILRSRGNYGSFVGVVALVGILYPFGAFGSGNLLVKKVALDRAQFPTAWGGGAGHYYLQWYWY